MREFNHPELDFNIASVRNPPGIFNGLPCIRKEPFHFLLALYVILAALIAHPVLVRQLFPRLDTEQNVVGLHVLLISVMHVVGNHQRDFQLPAHLQKGGVHHFLLGQPVVLELQEKVTLPEAVPVTERRLFRLVHKSF